MQLSGNTILITRGVPLPGKTARRRPLGSFLHGLRDVAGELLRHLRANLRICRQLSHGLDAAIVNPEAW
jgi:hypothetical protein